MDNADVGLRVTSRRLKRNNVTICNKSTFNVMFHAADKKEMTL